MAQLVYSIPLVLLAVVLIVLCTGLGVGGVLLFRRMGWEVEPDDNTGAGLLHAFIGVVYAVALGLIVVQVQGEYGEVDEAVVAEASAVGDLYRTMEGWSEPGRTQLRTELREYVRLVVQDEWPAVRAGGSSDTTWRQLDRIASGIVRLRPADDREGTLYGELLGDMDTLLDARRTRLFHGVEGIGPVMWTVIVLGGMVTLGFACAFHFASRRAQLVTTAVMGAMFGLMFFLIIAMDHPLWGDLAVRPDALVELQGHFRRMGP